MLHPELLAFHARLDAAGIVAARHADHLCVRLALLCSVRIRYDGQRLSYEPRFGAASRTLATHTAVGVAAAAVGGLALTGAAVPIVVTAGTLGVLAVAYDAMRYLVTESAITRATLLWGLEHPVDRSVAPPPMVEVLSPAGPELVPHPAEPRATVGRSTLHS
jgi:hypothetical protein